MIAGRGLRKALASWEQAYLGNRLSLNFSHPMTSNLAPIERNTNLKKPSHALEWYERGYHHGNLRQVLNDAALALITEGSSGPHVR
jgi:hypothetical protein